MHINGIVFLNTIPRHIIFATGSKIKNLKLKNIEDLIKQVNKIYLQYGFKITHIHAGNEFELLLSEMAYIGISINCAPNKEHVPDIEQFGRTVKESVQCSQALMTFKLVSKSMMVHIFATTMFWLNDFPPSKPGTGLSDTNGPGQLILGTIAD